MSEIQDVTPSPVPPPAFTPGDPIGNFATQFAASKMSQIIAEHLGWKKVEKTSIRRGLHKDSTRHYVAWQRNETVQRHPPNYSEDLSIAWEIVEQQKDKEFQLIRRAGTWVASFGGAVSPACANPALAICYALLTK